MAETRRIKCSPAVVSTSDDVISLNTRSRSFRRDLNLMRLKNPAGSTSDGLRTGLERMTGKAKTVAEEAITAEPRRKSRKAESPPESFHFC